MEELVPEHLLRLRAEMKLPGLAWLEFTVEQDGQGRAVLGQRATFYPRGLAGHAYWYAVMPFHGVVFGSMIRNISAAAVRRQLAADRRAQATATSEQLLQSS